VLFIDDLIGSSDYELFEKVCSQSHVLSYLLSRSCHSFQLPEYDTDLHKKSFTVRALYEYIK